MRLPTGAVPATAVRGAPRLPWAWFRRTCPGCFERGSRPFRTMPRRCRRITGSGQPKPPRRVLRFRPGVPGAVCSGMSVTAYAAASRTFKYGPRFRRPVTAACQYAYIYAVAQVGATGRKSSVSGLAPDFRNRREKFRCGIGRHMRGNCIGPTWRGAKRPDT